MKDSKLKILISGASGLVGTEVVSYFENKGYDVLQLQRKNPKVLPYWDIEKQIVILDKNKQIDVIIHLAGESIAENRWSRSKKDKILKSRVNGTKLLAEYFSKAEIKPKVFISCSAIGFYGNRKDEVLTEDSEKGKGFLSDVTYEWERATIQASKVGIRVVNIRLGMVLSKKGGALKKMTLPFKMGLGGIIGDGNQYISWISIQDLVEATNHVIQTSALKGAINFVAPTPVTNHKFTKTLGNILHRPTFLPLPTFLTKIIFGEMGEELLLSSTRVKPEKLENSGFSFKYPKLEMALYEEKI